MEKKEAAYILYLDGVEQTDIARMLSVSEVSVSKWATSGGWKSERVKASLFKKTSTEKVEEMILYQLKCLEHLKEDKQEMLIPLSSEDLKPLRELYGLIKRDELRWEECVRVIRRFMEQISNADNELAKSLLPHADAYINDLRKQLSR